MELWSLYLSNIMCTITIFTITIVSVLTLDCMVLDCHCASEALLRPA